MNNEPEFREFNGSHERFSEIERKYSVDKKYVAVVGKRNDGAYTYFIHQWDISDWEYIGEGYWTPVSVGGLFFDLESAKNEAYLEL